MIKNGYLFNFIKFPLNPKKSKKYVINLRSQIFMEKQPLISIITVVYNGEKTLEQTIVSVLSQTYPNIEYIIIDGKSSDGTIDIVSKYADKISKYVSEKDNGIYDAMNKGLALANGDIIGLLNADDFYEPDTIENVVNFYAPGLNIYYGAIRNIEENNDSFIRKATDNLEKLKRGMVINHPAMFVNNEVYEMLGGFNISYKVSADWDFTLRCYLARVNFFKIDKILTNFRIDGVSGAITTKYLHEMSQVRKTNGLFDNVDPYYWYDLLRFRLLGKNLHKLYLLKQKLLSAK